MYWWLIISSIIVLALVYAYRDQQSKNRLLTEVYTLLAEKYQGEVKPGSLLVFPQLRFQMDGRGFLVTSMATDGAESSSFTLASVDLPFGTKRKWAIKRRKASLPHMIDPTKPAGGSATGHAEFDEAFLFEASDPTIAAALLQEPVRRNLLESRLPLIDARLTGGKITVHSEGILESAAGIEEMIAMAALLARHCPQGPRLGAAERTVASG